MEKFEENEKQQQDEYEAIIGENRQRRTNGDKEIKERG